MSHLRESDAMVDPKKPHIDLPGRIPESWVAQGQEKSSKISRVPLMRVFLVPLRYLRAKRQ
jgi:hypothetical protein